jgi:hypothetical protein
MIIYLRDPKNSTKKTLKIINFLGNLAGYKISIQKLAAFLYANNKQTEKEIRETILFTIASKTIRDFGINLMIENKDLFNENYKALKREIGEHIRSWKDLLCSWIGRSNIVKMAIPPELTHSGSKTFATLKHLQETVGNTLELKRLNI